MGRVLVRKAEGNRKRGNLPKPLSEMTDEERKKYGMPSRADQRSGKALNIRGRKGVTSIPQAPREERGKGRSAEDKVTDVPEALQMNPETGAVRVRDRTPIQRTPEEMAQAEADYARRMEEAGPAIRGRQREAFEETDEDEREKRDIGASFRAGLNARRTIMQGQEDPKTGERRQKGFISENIQAGDEGAGLGNIGQVFDPSGVHPYFRSKQGPRDEIPVPKLLNRFLSSEPERFQAMFGADPSTVMSLGRSGRGSEEMRQMLIAQALDSIRQDPAKFQQFLTTQGLELSVDDTSMGALGSTQADLSDMGSIGDLARTLRLSQPGAMMFQQLDRMLQEQGLRMTPEAQRDLVAAANPGSFAEVQTMLQDVGQLNNQLRQLEEVPKEERVAGHDEQMSRIQRAIDANVMQNALQMQGKMGEDGLPMISPITTTTAGIAPELVGRGKEISIDAPEVRPAPQERDPEVTAQQRMDMRLQNEFETLVARGMATDEMDDEGKRTMFEQFKAAVQQSIDNQMDMHTRQFGDFTPEQSQLKERLMSEALGNALEQVTLRAEGGEFLSELDQIYGDRGFSQLDTGRRDAQQQADLEAAPLMTKISSLKLQLRQLDMLPEREKPADYREQMARIQSAIDKLQSELDTKFDATAVRPTEERQDKPMIETPSMKRVRHAFKTGQPIGVAGVDVQTVGRRGDQSPTPVQIPGMGGEQSDSRLDRTIPESQDEIRGRRRREKGRRESGAPIRGAPDFTSMTQEELERMLMGGGEAPAPKGPAPATTAESAVPPANMNFLERLRAGLDSDDNVETGQWMSVGEQLLKSIQDDMTQRILKSATRIPDDLRAGQFDSPAEQERKEMATRQLQEDAYENDPRTIAFRRKKKEQELAEMDRQAEEFRRFYGDKLPEP